MTYMVDEAFVQAARAFAAPGGDWRRFGLALGDLARAARAAHGSVPGDDVGLRASLRTVSLLADELRDNHRHSQAAAGLARHLVRALFAFGVTIEALERWPGFIIEPEGGVRKEVSQRG